MTALLKRNALLLMAIALPLMLSSSPADAQVMSSADDTYNVVFKPWGNRKIVFRDADGNFLGNSADGADLQMQVSGDVLRKSSASGEVDVQTLLSQLNPQVINGETYLMMEFPFDTTTAEGRVIPPGTKVMLDLRDFYQTRTLQPMGAAAAVDDPRDATPPQVQTTNEFNNTLYTAGVTEATRPDPLPVVGSDQIVDTGDEDDVNDSAYMAAGRNTYDVEGTSFGYTRFLSAPTCGCVRKSCRITSGYGYRTSRRTKNGRHMSHYHRGIDIGGGMGTPVVAGADGCVSRINRGGGYGTTIYLSHGNGLETQYSHLKSVGTYVKYGQCFKRGDRIGTMGETGNATGPHLHFNVVYRGVRKDPRGYMISVTGGSMSQTCNAQKPYPAIDTAMEKALGKYAPGYIARRQRPQRVQ